MEERVEEYTLTTRQAIELVEKCERKPESWYYLSGHAILSLVSQYREDLDSTVNMYYDKEREFESEIKSLTETVNELQEKIDGLTK